ncbi:MAG: MFS transporter [Sneathiellaceae bacterium]
MTNPLRGYLYLLRRDPALIAFGFLHAFLSSPGQTFFIALFVGAFAEAAGIGETGMGSLYLVATMAAAALLPWLGQWIDRLDLRLFAGLATAGLGLACLAAASAGTIYGVAASIMLLRLCGQGLMIHVEATATARHFGPDRGKALGLTALGLPLAEAVLPALAAVLLLHWGWRDAYLAIGLALLLVFLPLSQALLRGQRAYVTPPPQPADAPRRRVLDGMARLAESRFFWMALPALLFLPFTSTAMLFYVGLIAAAKAWPLDAVAQAFAAFALCHALALFLSGPLVDRFGARRLLPWMLLPKLAVIAILAVSDDRLALFLFLGGTGMAAGMAKTVVSALWAEIFGAHLVGSVRSAAMTLMVVSTAAGPALFGGALSLGFGLAAVLAALIAAGLAAIALAVAAPLPADRKG